MTLPIVARPPLPMVLQRSWRWMLLVLAALVPRLYLIRVFDVELSNDGFDAVNMLVAFQNRGLSAVSQEGVTRWVLHPLYMLLLYGLKIITPASVDFYTTARLLSTLFACLAVLLIFEFTRRSFGETAAWIAALLLAFAPSFLWESAAILSSTLFLALYLGVLLAIARSQYRLVSVLAALSAMTRTEGVALIALVLAALLVDCIRARRWVPRVWFVFLLSALAVPLMVLGSSWLATGNPLAFLGAQSIASIWLRFLASPDIWKRAAFFVTQYPALFPLPVVGLGLAGALVALMRHRSRATALLFAIAALCWLFFEALVWLNYTTLEVRFLMYPGLPLLVFAALALAAAHRYALAFSRAGAEIALGAVLLILLVMSFQQGLAGIRFVYNSQSSQREVVEELMPFIAARHPTNLMLYGGVAGALDYYARARGLELVSTDFRFAPDDQPEQYLVDRKIQYIIYPVGNAFAQAKYPYLARFDTQTHGPVTFQPLTQFVTSPDNQLYSIWAVSPGPISNP